MRASLAAFGALLVLPVASAEGPAISSFPVWDYHNDCLRLSRMPEQQPDQRHGGLVHSYKDPATGLVFHIEPDGQHLVAFDTQGKILWRRRPHDGIPDYRRAPACISFLGPPRAHDPRGTSNPHIGLSFDNSQFGQIDEVTGDFLFEGQD